MVDVKIYASIIDDITRQQVWELSESDAYRNAIIRIMPDCHAGKGCTIGSVIQYTGRVVPNTVGVDIGCGMLVLELGRVNVDLQLLDKVIHEKIPSGFNVHDTGSSYTNQFYAPISDWRYIEKSIGTLGGGNHFIEMDVDEKGNKYLVIHSGSRNLGVQVCDYWQGVAISNLTDDSAARKVLIEKLKAEGRQSEIQDALKRLEKPKVKKDLAYLEGKDLEGYLHDMRLCQFYASLNRATIANIICEHAKLYPKTRFETVHNYIDLYRGIIRKGAISAEKGKEVIIPMNMRDGSLLCIGRGNPKWLWSAPHGAGRIMSRAQARESLTLDSFKESMKDVYSTSVCPETIDEAPMAYKPMEQILEDIKDTVEIVKVIKPIYNFKAKQ